MRPPRQRFFLWPSFPEIRAWWEINKFLGSNVQWKNVTPTWTSEKNPCTMNSLKSNLFSLCFHQKNYSKMCQVIFLINTYHSPFSNRLQKMISIPKEKRFINGWKMSKFGQCEKSKISPVLHDIFPEPLYIENIFLSI